MSDGRRRRGRRRASEPGSGQSSSPTSSTHPARLLNCLHIAFNGDPDRIDDAFALMYELKNSAEERLQQPLTNYAGQFAGPCFRYVGP